MKGGAGREYLETGANRYEETEEDKATLNRSEDSEASYRCAMPKEAKI
jgi:hypothetical protein